MILYYTETTVAYVDDNRSINGFSLVNGKVEMYGQHPHAGSGGEKGQVYYSFDQSVLGYGIVCLGRKKFTGEELNTLMLSCGIPLEQKWKEVSALQLKNLLVSLNTMK